MQRISRVFFERPSASSSVKQDGRSVQRTRSGEVILYKDRFACLTRTKLKLYDYYMTGLSRTTHVDRILAVVSTDDLGLRWDDRNSGGLALRARILWTNDWRRGALGLRQNDDVLIVVKNEKWRKGFSLENRTLFMSLLQSLIDDVQCSNAKSESHDLPEQQQQRRYLQ